MIVSIETALLENGYLIRPVEGDSMMPLLDQHRDTVKIVPVSTELKKYDIPLYRRPNGKLVLHRIIKVEKNGFITCGDNRFRTEFVPKEWVIAVAVGVFKGENYHSLDQPDMMAYAKSIVNKRFLRCLKSIPKRIKRRLVSLKHDKG